MKSVRLIIALLLCIIVLFGISCGGHSSRHKTSTPTQQPTYIATSTPVVSPTGEPAPTATSGATSVPTPTSTSATASTPTSAPGQTSTATPASSPAVTAAPTDGAVPTEEPTDVPDPTSEPTTIATSNPTTTPIPGTNTVYCEKVGTKTHGSSFTLKVMALNITPNVDTGQFDLRYDPNIISVSSVSAGAIGGTSIPMVKDGDNLWNVITSGVPDGKHILRVLVDPASAASGSGYFCQITFNATAAGKSALEFVADEGNPQGDLQLIQGGFPVVYLAVTWISGNVTVQ